VDPGASHVSSGRTRRAAANRRQDQTA
jgi:hypothetical protein